MIFFYKISSSLINIKEPEPQFVISAPALAPGGNLISAPRLRLRNTALLIRDVYPGSLIRIFPSRILIKEFKYFNKKNCFLALGNMIWVVHPGFES
jgi:hypothetical protein